MVAVFLLWMKFVNLNGCGLSTADEVCEYSWLRSFH